MEGKIQQKQSRFGIASIILCLLIYILANLIFLSYTAFSNNPWFEIFRTISQTTTVCFSTIIINGLALGLGIIGIFEKNRNRLFAYIGIGISILFIIAQICVYFGLKDLSNITL